MQLLPGMPEARACVCLRKNPRGFFGECLCVGKLCCLVLRLQAVCRRGSACTCGPMPPHYLGVPSTLLQLICMLQSRLHILHPMLTTSAECGPGPGTRGRSPRTAHGVNGEPCMAVVVVRQTAFQNHCFLYVFKGVLAEQTLARVHCILQAQQCMQPVKLALHMLV